MVEHAHIDQRQGGFQGLREGFVCPAGLHAAAGVVVRQHHTGGLVVQGAQHHLARVHAGLRERAAKQLFHAQQAVLRIEKQHGKHLVPLGGQVQLQVVLDGIGRVKHLAFTQLLGQGAARQLQHRHQFGTLGGAQAFDAFQVAGAGMQQPGDAAKSAADLAAGRVQHGRVQQLLRHLQHAFAHDARAQQDGQQLCIGQGCGATGQQFFAGLGFGGQVLDGHGAGGFGIRSAAGSARGSQGGGAYTPVGVCPVFYNRGSLSGLT